MRFYTGIITPNLAESKQFYTTYFGFQVKYELDWFVLLEAEGRELGFMTPNHPSQSPRFQGEYGGQGTWITMEVEDVDSEYDRLRLLGVPIEVELRTEPYGDRHFVVVDPNGVGVDVVTFVGVEEG